MAIPVTFDFESPRWLRNMRWIGVLGLLAASVAAEWFHVQIPLRSFLAVIAGFAAWNLVLPLLEFRLFGDVKSFLFLQLLVDLLVVTLLLWWSGGLVNPFVSYFVLIVLIAGLLLNSSLTVGVAFLASACILLLTQAPAMRVGEAVVELRSSPIWYALPCALVLLIGFVSVFILLFLHRLGRAQDEARFRLKMEALARLVMGLAHEIGTPLNSILLVAKELEDEVAPAHKKGLGIILNQAKRCGEIVSLLLGYSHTLVRRGEDVQYSPVALRPWIEETYAWLVEAEEKKHPTRVRAPVEFRVEVEEGLSETVSVPQLILRQVLKNLLENARDAVAKVADPKIIVRCSIDLVEGELEFAVEDNGPGFSQEERERAFEAFFSTKKQELSSGLGLYMSYYLLTQVGGRIVIAEHQGRGAILRVSLPRLEGLDVQALVT